MQTEYVFDPRGELLIVPTPLGNLGDASPRSREVLAGVDLIAAEDTRNTGKLLQLLGIKGKGRLISYHDHNASQRSQELTQRILREGISVALVSDAGTPGCSDPGVKLVQAAAKAGIKITPLPGPAAFLCALVASGLPTHRFLFVGFLPSKSTGRQKELEKLKTRTATLCFYESPRRVQALLQDVEAILGKRRVSVSRELTKLHEETVRGLPAEVSQTLEESDGLRGEFCVIIEGAPEAAPQSAESADILRLIALLRDQKLKPKQIKEVVSSYCGLSKKEVFALMNGLP